MAKAQKTVNMYSPTSRAKRPGIHAKSKTSKIKGNDLYKKQNVGQGKSK